MVQSATYSAVGGALMKRTSTGAVSVAEPTAGVHAANRNYVDGAVSASTATINARIDARPALFSGPGAPPSTISGARVGDYWLNTTNMQLHRITGV